MEAKVAARSLQIPAWMNPESVVRNPNNYSLHFSQNAKQKQRDRQIVISCYFQPNKVATQQRRASLKLSCCSQNFRAQVLESKPDLYDEILTLKKKSEEVEPHLNGRCIYLVGMMGSGKTTVGRVLSEALGYSFYDCDKLIEQAVGGTTVADIFKLYGESFFRDNETEVLKKLSLMHRRVISTGGGAVVRPINWKHMGKGISIFLDVPLDALACRITKDGTQSRPLLHGESGDAYEQTLRKLSALWEERGEAYSNADARVSLEKIAVKLGYEDVRKMSPTAIAIEALIQLEYILKR